MLQRNVFIENGTAIWEKHTIYKGGGIVKVQTIAAWDLEKKRKETKAILVDLREQEEYNSGHIPGAVWIPYEQLLKKPDIFDKSQELILYCDRGNASLMTGRILGEKGYNVYTVLGGYRAYKRMNEKDKTFG